jgi:hypothetical protein
MGAMKWWMVVSGGAVCMSLAWAAAPMATADALHNRAAIGGAEAPLAAQTRVLGVLSPWEAKQPNVPWAVVHRKRKPVRRGPSKNRAPAWVRCSRVGGWWLASRCGASLTDEVGPALLKTVKNCGADVRVCRQVKIECARS